MTTATRTIDETKLMSIIGQAVNDFGATLSAALVVIGDRLGLYRSLAGKEATPAELARRTGTDERYVSQWLINQAAGGYVDYDRDSGRYSLSAEQAAALADENSPFFVAGGFELVTAAAKAEPRITEAFRTGRGLPWGEHDAGLFSGTERFFRPGYVGNLVANWIPALDGVKPKLDRGARVADVGCGHGASTILMAQAFPNSRFYGFDTHAPSIERARRAAQEAGVADRVTFEVAGGADFPGTGYDLVAFFDCLHDMGDPVATTAHTYRSLAADGTVLIVEPMAGENVDDNFNPVGRVFSGASVLVCTPNAVATGQTALGTIATEAQIAGVVRAGGFGRFRRATETPFNRIFEARR